VPWPAAVPLPAERVRFEPSWWAVAGELAARARPGDLVVTMGAGDVTMIGPELLDLLHQR
jgi:UDP-N-acetylmuramate--alanine ligase